MHSACLAVGLFAALAAVMPFEDFIIRSWFAALAAILLTLSVP
jgi:hypothetical protein